MMYVPHRPIASITNDILTAMVQSQNLYLATILRTVIPTNTQLFNETWNDSMNIGDYWRKIFTEALSEGNPIFHSVDTGHANKVDVFYEKPNQDAAIAYINEFKQKKRSLITQMTQMEQQSKAPTQQTPSLLTHATQKNYVRIYQAKSNLEHKHNLTHRRQQ